MNLYVIGGHSGDEAVMAGALAHKYVSHGHKVFFVSMTNGDGGHPTLSREAYRIQKDREAAMAAQSLGAECILYPCSSGALNVGEEATGFLAELFRKSPPDLVITHWRGTIHRDHEAAHWNTIRTLKQSDFSEVPLYFAENWEDKKGFLPDLWLSVDETDIEAWEKACSCFQFFRDSFYKFSYRTYYRNLFQIHGLESRSASGFAVVLMQHCILRHRIVNEIPDVPLEYK
ncbi:MAG: PIG-L family deacetylase [Lachnospiraceae bacterium]|nr:PIG-L family deacetylase [Lachnospiraceae bacterium]MBO4632784.1 PIG-L family deacetylase [Lentisphaeria bacterium]